ncbi:MAG: hypothetical protein IKZ53_03440 [Selenomonadaceae bacterium]|nr:hypothetical protein [Selenomonadaceae bacterium]
MEIDFEKLDVGLNNLRGFDFEAVSKEERATGNTSVLMATDEKFQIRLAARALGINVNDIRELPLKTFVKVQQRVFNFLFGTSGEETIAQDK